MSHLNKIRLLIADDHEVVRTGLKNMLGDEEFKVVAEVTTGQDAVKYALENDVASCCWTFACPTATG